MKKRLLAFALVTAILFTACGTASGVSNSTKETEPQETEAESTKGEESEKTEEEKGTEEEAPKEKGRPQLRIQSIGQNEGVGDNIGISAEIAYPLLSEESEGDYPELAKNFSQLKEEKEKLLSENLSALRESGEELAEYQKDVMDLEDKQKLELLRADSKLVSFLVSYENYYGGAHGGYELDGLCYDTESGKRLNITDILADKDRFFSEIQERLKTDYSDVYSDMWEPENYVKELSEAESPEMCWTVDSECLTVYFNPYVLGSYAMGCFSLSFYFDEYPGLFREEYTEAAPDYVILPSAVEEVHIDTGSGQREKLGIDMNYDAASDGFTSAKISLGDRSCEFDTWGYAYENYLFHSGDKYFLYIELSEENDYHSNYVVDLQSMSCDRDKNIGATLDVRKYSDRSGEGFYHQESLKYPPVNPKDFYLSKRIDTLSTGYGIERCHLGEDGYPLPSERGMEIQGDRALKLRKDMDFMVVNEDGVPLGAERIPAGTYLFFVGTDGSSWLEMQVCPESEIIDDSWEDFANYHVTGEVHYDKEKPLYHFSLGMEEYPYYVNGENAEEVFEGMQYAG